MTINSDINYKQWVQKCPNNLYSVKCKVCLKIISVAALGTKALEKHANGNKHKQCMPVCDKYAIKTVVEAPAMPKEALCTQQTSIVLFTESQLANKAEIMWEVNVVLSKHSF